MEKTISMQITITESENKIIQKCKDKFDIGNKSDAVRMIIKEFGKNMERCENAWEKYKKRK